MCSEHAAEVAGIFHVRADILPYGFALLLTRGIDGGGCARKVIVVAEEIVAPEVIASDPNRTLIPGFLVAAILNEPWGAHPSPVQGYYGRDHAFFTEYHEQSRKQEDFERWLENWVLKVSSRADYVKQLGDTRTAARGVRVHAFTAPADFGF